MLTVTLKLKNPPATGDRWVIAFGTDPPADPYTGGRIVSSDFPVADPITASIGETYQYLIVAVFFVATGVQTYRFETTTPFVFTNNTTYIWDCAANSLSVEAPAPVPLNPIDVIFSFVWDLSDWIKGWADSIWSWIPGNAWFHDRLHDVSDWLFDLLTPIANFGDWVDDVVNKVANILSSVDILDLLSTWLTYAEDAWNWVQDAASIISTYITSWWSTASLTVQGWVDTALDTATTLIDTVSASLATLQTTWDDFWTLTFPTLITSLDASTLIDSALQVWFPFYDDLVNIWNDIKLFFSNPLDYLLDKFTDWFLGKE